MNDLLEAVRKRNFRAIARVITRIENSDEAAFVAVSSLYQYTGRAHIVGITGPPGSGKSTLVNELARQFADEGGSVAIIAVDPSSPYSGGALLGDRIRMRDLANYKNIFIRSMASRGNLGGLASSTSAVIHVFDAAKFDVILVETVGAGQAEVEIANAAHTTLVIEAPGMGDEVQSSKAGILEIADILVVNKVDRPGAARTIKALELMVQMGSIGSLGHHNFSSYEPAAEDESPEQWQVEVLQTTASEGKGIAELIKQIRAHKAFLFSTNGWVEREKLRSLMEVERLLKLRFISQIKKTIPEESREELVMAVVNREVDPYSAADKLFSTYYQLPNE